MQPFSSVFRDYILYPSISVFYPLQSSQSSGLNSLLKHLEYAEAVTHIQKSHCWIICICFLNCSLNTEKLSLYCCAGQKTLVPVLHMWEGVCSRRHSDCVHILHLFVLAVEGTQGSNSHSLQYFKPSLAEAPVVGCAEQMTEQIQQFGEGEEEEILSIFLLLLLHTSYSSDPHGEIHFISPGNSFTSYSNYFF